MKYLVYVLVVLALTSCAGKEVYPKTELIADCVKACTFKSVSDFSYQDLKCSCHIAKEQ